MPTNALTPGLRARTIGYFAAWVLLLSHVARLYIQVIDSFLVAMPTTEMVGQLFFSTRAWGLGILAQTIISASLVGAADGDEARAAEPCPG